jgi:aspartyl-tRNA(Asn)/glutamyl-tRNA(Gln) amidotransferase subunit C
MQVDDALIAKLSRLSMLDFDEAEKEEIKADLVKMIGFVDKLKELDTSGIDPLLHMSGNNNMLR